MTPAMHLAIALDRFDPERGGAERYLAELAARWVARGHAVSIYCTEAVAAPTGVRVVVVPAGGWTRVARERRFAAAVARAARADGCAPLLAIRHVPQADVYQPHGGGWAAAAAARRAADPWAWRRAAKGVLQRFAPRHRWFRAVERELLERGDVTVLAVSPQVRDELLAIAPAAKDRCHVLLPAIASARFAGIARARLEPSSARSASRPPQLLFCGHDFRLKGLSHALRAFARSGARDRGARLQVVGRGPPGRWRREAVALGIAAQVDWCGASADLALQLRESALLLHPTWFDPCALVCLEAMAAGVPVVTTRCNGAAPLVIEAGGRVVAQPTDHAELAAAIDALLAVPASVAATAAVAALRVARIDWEDHLAQLEPLLLAAAARGRSR